MLGQALEKGLILQRRQELLTAQLGIFLVQLLDFRGDSFSIHAFFDQNRANASIAAATAEVRQHARHGVSFREAVVPRLITRDVLKLHVDFEDQGAFDQTLSRQGLANLIGASALWDVDGDAFFGIGINWLQGIMHI